MNDDVNATDESITQRPFMGPKQFQYALWGMAVLLLLIGALCFYSSYQVPAAKPEAAAKLRGLCFWSLGFSLLVVAIERITSGLVRST